MDKTIYLCGPIHGRSDADCNGWRGFALAHWDYGLVLDPMRRDARGRMHEDGIEVEIVEQDKRDIDEADGLLVFFDKPSVGTAMEILYAYERDKPVVIVNASGQHERDISLWLRYHSCNVFDVGPPWGPNGGTPEAINATILHALDQLCVLIQRKQEPQQQKA